MSQDLRQRVEDLFEAALDLPTSLRAAFIASAADGDERLEAEVRALLAAHDRAGLLERSVVPRGPAHRSGLSEIVGPYRIIGELGRGGMGVVYAAERADGQFRRRVAIKVLRADADPSLEGRVVAERQILASLDHPNIARLLDGGVTGDGRPFLVMEHVDGLPIDVYADRMRLTVEERLDLFVATARAVDHAHRNLIVHRDLKPSNILVTSRGEVKLLDFGIAKLLNPALGPASPYTATDQRALTPEYASPEQVRNEPLTTASDVYSLGVVLYRLLCGCHPYTLDSHSMKAIVDTVCYQDPDRPSDRTRATASMAQGRPDVDPGAPSETSRPGGATPAQVAEARRTTPERLRRLLRGDLDAIALKALRKEAADRYGSADALAHDLERHREGLPVQARRGSSGYRLRKLVRRHRYEAAAAALIVLSLLAGAGTVGWQARVASAERDRAEEALRQSEEVTDFLMRLFSAGERIDLQLEEISAADLLRRGVARAESLGSQPLVQARMLGVIGRLHVQLGQYGEATEILRRSLAGLRSTLGPEHTEVALAMNQLGLALGKRAAYDAARSLHTDALRIQRAGLGPRNPEVAATLGQLASIEFDLNQRESILRQALDIQVQALGPDHGEVIGTLIVLANTVRGLGRYEEDADLLRRALDAAGRTFGPDHPRTAEVMLHLADNLYEFLDQPREGERLLRRALDIQRLTLGETDLSQVHGLHSLGDLLARQRRFEESERHLRRAGELLIAALGASHPRTAESRMHLADGLLRQGRLVEAERIFRDAISVWEQSLGPRHPSVATARGALGTVLLTRGRGQAAEQEVSEALSIRRESLGERSLMVGLTLTQLGDVARTRGQIERARDIYRESRSILLEHLPPGHPQVRDVDLRLQAMRVSAPGPTSAGPHS